MGKVRLLLSGNTKLNFYVDAVTAAGGEATAQYLPAEDTSYDGLVLCGGNDVDPKYYNEPVDGSVNIDLPRDEAEFRLLDAFVKAGKPVLGICRGHQLINIYFGGSLYQDIPEAELHTNRADFYCTHEVSAVKGSRMEKLYGERFTVNSSHHQAAKRLGEELVPTAYWQGQYIEAFEHTELPILGVQWHPERMCCSQKRENTADGLKIFKAFVEVCKEKQRRFSFAYADRQQIDTMLPELFGVLYENMSQIAPTGNTYEEDYACWKTYAVPEMEKDTQKTIIMRAGDVFAGFFRYSIRGDSLLMEEIQIKKEFHGSGIFAAFYTWFVKQLPKDILWVEAYTSKTNTKTQGILEHLGLRKAGENKNGKSFYYKGEYASLLDKYG